MRFFVSLAWLERTVAHDWTVLPLHDVAAPGGHVDRLARLDEICRLNPGTTDAVMCALGQSAPRSADSGAIAVVEPGRPHWPDSD